MKKLSNNFIEAIKEEQRLLNLLKAAEIKIDNLCSKLQEEILENPLDFGLYNDTLIYKHSIWVEHENNISTINIHITNDNNQSEIKEFKLEEFIWLSDREHAQIN